MPNWFRVPVLNRRRIWAAFLLALAVDALQVMLGPVGWLFLDQTLDLVAAALMIPLIGFHPLLLPTFILEFLPVANMLPTWTACVALVVALRRNQITTQGAPPLSSSRPVIDV